MPAAVATFATVDDDVVVIVVVVIVVVVVVVVVAAAAAAASPPLYPIFFLAPLSFCFTYTLFCRSGSGSVPSERGRGGQTARDTQD